MSEQDEKIIETPFIHCPNCKGSGQTEKGKTCPNCLKIGLGSFLFDRFVYWEAPLSKTNISLRKIKKIIDLIINLLAWLVLAGGIFCLAFYFWQNIEEISLENLIFWDKKNILILSFYFGILAMFFIIYRISRKKAGRKKIKIIKKPKEILTPDNWEELRRTKKKIEISGTLDENTLKAVEKAYLFALKLRHSKILPLHLFSAMLGTNEMSAFFSRLNVSAKILSDKLNYQFSLLGQELKKESALEISPETKEILLEGFLDAYRLGQNQVDILSLIYYCVKKDKIIQEILLDLKIDENKIKNTVSWFRINEKQFANYKAYKKLASFKPKTSMDRAYTAIATPFLNNFAYDLTLAAKWGRLELCVAREKEMENIFDALKSGKNGIILTGSEGVGKKTIINGIAMEMVKENVPDFLKDKRLLELDVARLISGANPAEAEERLLIIINEVARAGNIILYIENLENMLGISAGEEESLELSEVLSGAIDRKNIFCLCSASDTNYLKYIENTAIGKLLDRIKIKEPVGDQAILILESKIGGIEARHKVFFSYSAIEAAVSLATKFIHDKYLPEKAIDLLEKTAVDKAANAKKTKNFICDKNDVALTVNRLTDIPVQEVEGKEGEELLNLESQIHEYMINQEEAVNAVADSLRRARAQLNQGKRPIASFLFMGPTGVGKTELAKAITRVYFKKNEYLTRLDMSEYQHEDSVVKMIGDHNTSGYLTEAVRTKPFSLILLDEFEKAHPKIFNLFLQVMDDGRLTDGQGRTIDFTSSIIIATSNAGSDYIQKEVASETPIEKIKNTLINEHLTKIMRPELVNRFDGIIVFKPLSRQNIVDIAKLMLKDMEKMLGEKGILLEITESGAAKLAEEGYDPKFGARPLRRLIQDKIENKIAKLILANKVKRRDTIVINENAELEIKKAGKI